MYTQFLFILALILLIVNGVYGSVKQTQHWFDYQLKDHFDPLNRLSFKQRYWVIDEFYNPEKGPVLLYICGEYTCPGLPEARQWPAQIAQKYEGIILVLEHRYYGESVPFGETSMHFDKLNLLTVEQALADLANFIQYMKQSRKHNIKPESPWITIGGSYPGALSAWFRYKYPHLTVGALASSAVINAIQDYPQFDEQMRKSALKSGEWCAQSIHDLNLYAQSVIEDESTSHQFKARFNATYVQNNQFMFYYADIFVGFIQYGNRTWLCDQLKGKTVQENSEFIVNLANENGISVKEYNSIDNQYDGYDPDSSSRQWLYQYCTQFGWFQVAPEDIEKSLRSPIVDSGMYNYLCGESFVHFIYPTSDRVNLELGGLNIDATNIVFTNGSEDPWKTASLLSTNSTSMISIEIDCDDCAHCVDLYTPKDGDSQVLKQARQSQLEQISSWINQYNKKYGYEFNTVPKQNKEIKKFLH